VVLARYSNSARGHCTLCEEIWGGKNGNWGEKVRGKWGTELEGGADYIQDIGEKSVFGKLLKKI